MSIQLKPCPNPECGNTKLSMLGSVELRLFVTCGLCEMSGPIDDPDGAKWNALPRAGDHRTPGTIEVPVSEVEALAAGLSEGVSGDHAAMRVAASAIIARLPPREPDHVAILRKLAAGYRPGTIVHNALEAAIRKMGGEP